jgi:hypothetical protein
MALVAGGGGSVSSPTYRERAARCLRAAERAAQPEIKAVLVRLAWAWPNLAWRQESATNSEDQSEARKTGTVEGD